MNGRENASKTNRGLIVGSHWYKLFGLLHEPVLRNEPLLTRQDIRSFFVKLTEIENFILSLSDPHSQPGQVYAIIGDNGSGKTSLLKYLEFETNWYSEDICWISISDPPPRAARETPIAYAEVDNWLYRGILDTLKGNLPQENTREPSTLIHTIRISAEASREHATMLAQTLSEILRLRDMLMEQKRFRAFVIQIDGLHMVLSSDEAYDYLKGKQGFFEQLIQKPVQIFIVGAKEWKQPLAKPALSGVVPKTFSMPNWHEASAAKLLRKRFEQVAPATKTQPVWIFPFSDEAMEKMLKPNVGIQLGVGAPAGTPRYILAVADRVLKNLPASWKNRHEISGAEFSELVSVPTPEQLKEIEAMIDSSGDMIQNSLRTLARLPEDKRSPLYTLLFSLFRRQHRLGRDGDFVTDILPRRVGQDFTSFGGELPSMLRKLVTLGLLKEEEVDLTKLRAVVCNLHLAQGDDYIETLRQIVAQKIEDTPEGQILTAVDSARSPSFLHEEIYHPVISKKLS